MHTVKRLILAVPAALALAGCGTAAAAIPPHINTHAASLRSLSCRAYMSKARPADNSTTVVHVRTQASVKVFTVAFYMTVHRAYFVRASRDGKAQITYYVSGATPGRNVQVVVTVVRRHKARSCSTAFTPQKAGSHSPSPSPRPPSPSPSPSPRPPSPSPSPSSPTPVPSSPAACYPRAADGNCYMPGEFCPKADHGMLGIAGNGEAIVCDNNDGWRWEPA